MTATVTGTGTDARIALLFPGQGAQQPGMGLAWLDSPHWSVVDRLSATSVGTPAQVAVLAGRWAEALV